MNRKKFLKQSAMLTVGLAAVPSIALSKKNSPLKNNSLFSSTGFSLPEIPYGYSAFPNVIDSKTMEIHHKKHHNGYTNKLNKACAKENIKTQRIEEILSAKSLSSSIQNNGGGYYNHCLYWDILTPGGSMSKEFDKKITASFGSKESFLNELTQAAKTRFGSGWAWLYQDNDKNLKICSTANQDNPLMQHVKTNGNPLLGIDVWEHAYYLKYQNKRGEYIQNILKIINWEKVENRMI
ncbi:MAG: superoxide dismutase [Crocinitomicaceae bacterium]|nr:superoxide dismutase [Crocinitomicaceae bacterium]